MFGLPGIQEFVYMIIIITVLSMTGLWPRIMQGLRELRGDAPDPTAGHGPNSSSSNGNTRMTAQEMDMCYKILGLSPSATWPEIEKAYRQKAKIHHPDHGGDEDTMRVLNDAYSQLKRTRRSA